MNDTGLQQGDILAGKYRVDNLLGFGAMGVVVGVTDLLLVERRALKCMHPHTIASPKHVERFIREGRAALRLRSDHVARVYDVGKLDDQSPFIVMEYLDGRTLKTLMREEGPLGVQEAAGYILQICEVLAEAHRAGIIHRDLKPSNLFLVHRLDGSPCIKVLDFGVSKLLDSGADVTGTGVSLGSPMYMAPEQMRSARSVDARADIWSLGMIFYQLVTGRLPFPGDDMETRLLAMLNDGPVPISTLLPESPIVAELDEVILRCLRKDRAERYASVEELALKVRPLAFPNARFTPPPPRARPRGVEVASLAMFALGLASLTVVAVSAARLDGHPVDAAHAASALQVPVEALAPSLPYALREPLRAAPDVVTASLTREVEEAPARPSCPAVAALPAATASPSLMAPASPSRHARKRH